MNRCAVAVFVYPGVEIFLKELLLSLKKQTIKTFDLIIFNDGLTHVLLEYLRLEFINDLFIRIVPVSGTVAKIRQHGLLFLKSEFYDYVIWVDADDYMDDNRVEVALKKLDFYDIVVNDLHVIAADGQLIERHYLSHRLHCDQEITHLDIETKNFIGFSNSSLNLQKLLHRIEIPHDLIAVDWYLYYYLMKNGFSAIFTNETATSYRQHTSNTVGVQKFTRTEIMRGIDVKCKHYAAVTKHDPSLLGLLEYYRNLLKHTEVLDNKIQELLVLKDQGQLSEKPLWWEFF